MSTLVSPNHHREKTSEGTKLVIRARGDQPGTSLPKRGPITLRKESRILSEWTLEEFEANPVLLIMFLSDHCPYVQHLRQEIVKLASFYMEKGLGVLGVSANSDGPDVVAEEAEEARDINFPFRYWYDEEQDVAKALSAVCTPEFFLYKEDDDRKSFVLVYHGQFDDSRPYNDVPVTGRDLRNAIDCVLNDLPVPSDQKPCVGCSIKWDSDS